MPPPPPSPAVLWLKKTRLFDNCLSININTENSPSNEPHEFVLFYCKDWNYEVQIKISCSSKLVCSLIYVKKYKRTLQKQQAQNNSSNVEWWVWIAWRFLFSVRYSKLYRAYHKKDCETLPTNHAIFIYINKINNKLLYKKRYKLEWTTWRNMVAQKNCRKTKKMEKMYQSGWNICSKMQVNRESTYPEKSEIICTFMSCEFYLILYMLRQGI